MTVTNLATVAAEGEKLHDLPIPAVAFGLIGVAVFGLLLLVTFAFRSVSNRH